MRAITDIGQAEIKVNGRVYFLSPSFLAMTRIGRPNEIVTSLVQVNGGHYPNHSISDKALRIKVIAICYARMVSAAVRILRACCEDDITDVIGHYDIMTSGRVRMREGLIPCDDVIWLARDLIKHGVLGDQKNDGDEEVAGEFSNKFDARAFVYLAVAHIGMSEEEAWNMTMTSFRAAFAAKFPKPDKPKIPSKNDYDKAMVWADAVSKRDAARKK
jgi:hypothetical protein